MKGMSNPHKPRLVGRVPANRALTTRQTSSSKLNDSFKYREAATYLMELPPSTTPQGTQPPGAPLKGTPSSIVTNGKHSVNIGGFADDAKGAKDSSNQRDVFYVVGLPISTWSTGAQFFFLMGSIFFFFIIYGYCQELIFSFEEFKSFGWYLTLTQFGCYTIFGLLATQVQSDNQRRIPLKTYILLSILTVTTMGMSNASLGYLNYPTQVIFKCCKLIPVMLGGVLIQGKPYGLTDTCAAICMSVGLIFFTLADSTVSPKFDRTGIILISLALCADAIIGNVQEKAMKAHRASSSEVVLYSYSIGFVFIFVGLVGHGSFLEAFWFCYQHPVKTYVYAVLFSLSGYLGIIFVLAMIRQFGALITVTVTTTRKTVTMVLSFLLFSKPFTMQYLWSGMLVIFGIFLNVYSKNKATINHWFSNKVRQLVIRLQHQPKSYPSAMTEV
ncbi:adenosine 3'-phospho 5'-phosphosulfate transporter 2-like isoform X1 [Lytechinus variegatus]|uniref:adenosine 3'-phospho 5'-phosphosulfate transporter 2-like isoform X1 n=2 Tax=Lytechinus variegatus TaxID=7654 RepID=UPI001BB18312|nr:adenosine 3'-phospho 5'-phosphosulfate transporter 2-like isoform X1 [Lytechinus variegatus]